LAKSFFVSSNQLAIIREANRSNLNATKAIILLLYLLNLHRHSYTRKANYYEAAFNGYNILGTAIPASTSRDSFRKHAAGDV
jgi:hypothetical protein